MTTVNANAANRVANRYRSLVAKSDAVLEPIVESYIKDLRAELSRKRYPPKLAGQRYVRTGRLGSSYSARRVGKSSWSVMNSAPYSQYVVDEKRQAGIHQGRWYTMQEIEREKRPELRDRIVKAVTDYATV